MTTIPTKHGLLLLSPGRLEYVQCFTELFDRLEPPRPTVWERRPDEDFDHFKDRCDGVIEEFCEFDDGKEDISHAE